MKDEGKAFMKMLIRRSIPTQKMHVMCTASGGMFQVACIDGVDCTVDHPRVYQIPEKEDTVFTEEGTEESSVANTEVDNTAINNKKRTASIETSPSLALGYGGTELSKIIAECEQKESTIETL